MCNGGTMKITIDTENKILTVEEETNIKEVFDFIRSFNGWEEYKIISRAVVITKERPYTRPWYTGPLPTVTYTGA